MNSTKNIKITNSQGVDLAAKLDLPTDQLPQAFAILAHCFTCSKDLHAMRHLARALSQAGFGVLRFDFTGLGQSGGDFKHSHFAANIEDLIVASEYLKEHWEAPKLLVGHSLGGAAVLQAGRQLDYVEAIATIGAPAHPEHVKRLFAHKEEEVFKNGEAEVKIEGRTFTISQEFFKALDQSKDLSWLKDLDKSLLILHSPQDRVVGIENASDLYQAAWHPKSYISLDGADHLLSASKDSRFAGEMIASWAKRYIDWPEKAALESQEQVVVRIANNAFTSDVKAGAHALTADEPVSLGGNGFGPTPYELLLSSLGACTVMTLKMYAQRKEWPLEEVLVHLSHQKVHAKDGAHFDQKGAKIDRIERQVEISGELDQAQREKLLEIADKCPVHRTLHGDVEVETKLI